MSDLSEWREELAGVLGEHSPTETPHGPPYCPPCSEAIGDWVQWTPEHAADAILASPAMARLLAEARAGALRDAADEYDYLLHGGHGRIAAWLRARAQADDHAGEAKLSDRSAEREVLTDTLERLVCLLERGDYVPFGLIAGARGLVDAARALPLEGADVVCLVCGRRAVTATCDGTLSAHCVTPPGSSERGDQ